MHTLSWVCDGYFKRSLAKSSTLDGIPTMGEIPISTAPAVEPAMIDLNALG